MEEECPEMAKKLKEKEPSLFIRTVQGDLSSPLRHDLQILSLFCPVANMGCTWAEWATVRHRGANIRPE